MPPGYEDPFEISDCVVKTAQLRNLEAECFASFSDRISISIERNDIKTSAISSLKEIGARVISKNRMGLASQSVPALVTKNDLGKLVDSAIRLSQRSAPDPLNSFPDKGKSLRSTSLYDPSVARFSNEQAVLHAREMIRAASRDKTVMIDSGAFNVERIVDCICNSNGLAMWEKRTVFSWYLSGWRREGDAISNWDYEFDCAHFLKDVDTASTGERFASSTSRVTLPIGFQRFTGSLILAPNAILQLVVPPLSSAISSQSAQAGRSPWSQKVGEEVTCPDLSIIDDSKLRRGFGSKAFDREGTPHRPLQIVREGRLLSFIYNCRTAAKEGKRSTGHAFGDARSLPRVGITNLVLQANGRSLEELVKETRQGLFISNFSGFPDNITGDFSGTAKGAFLIQRGTIRGPVRGAIISGNVFACLSNMLGASTDIQQVFRCRTPHITVKQALIQPASTF